ncbi:hypothetical protein [Labilibaculum manganireducens]|uniref:hypothetical protein n=1 Tax=Labilibaculum manganireducens TaxID=1940525 RepID=UPI0029F52F55|nr:hypothetical protein [Labilibaculum manganireducens]
MTVNPAAVIRCQYDNHLGSASLELDESAGIISYEEYHPFGTTSYRSGRTELRSNRRTPLKMEYCEANRNLSKALQICGQGA